MCHGDKNSLFIGNFILMSSCLISGYVLFSFFLFVMYTFAYFYEGLFGDTL